MNTNVIHLIEGGGITVGFDDWAETTDYLVLFVTFDSFLKVPVATIWKNDKGAKTRIKQVKRLMPK